MTVLVNGTAPAYGAARRPRKPLLAKALGVFVPKPRITAAEKRRNAALGWVRAHGRRLKDTLVAVVVTGLPTVAAFEWHTWAGLVCTAAALLVVDAVADPSPPDGDAQ